MRSSVALVLVALIGTVSAVANWHQTGSYGVAGDGTNQAITDPSQPIPNIAAATTVVNDFYTYEVWGTANTDSTPNLSDLRSFGATIGGTVITGTAQVQTTDSCGSTGTKSFYMMLRILSTKTYVAVTSPTTAWSVSGFYKFSDATCGRDFIMTPTDITFNNGPTAITVVLTKNTVSAITITSTMAMGNKN